MTKKYMTVHLEKMEKKTRLGLGQHICVSLPTANTLGILLDRSSLLSRTFFLSSYKLSLLPLPPLNLFV